MDTFSAGLVDWREPVGGADHVDGDLEARVAIAGQGLRNIAE